MTHEQPEIPKLITSADIPGLAAGMNQAENLATSHVERGIGASALSDINVPSTGDIGGENSPVASFRALEAEKQANTAAVRAAAVRPPESSDFDIAGENARQMSLASAERTARESAGLPPRTVDLR